MPSAQSPLVRVHQLIADFGLTPEQVFPTENKKGGRRKGASMPRYRVPVSGSTWSGMGRQPSWIKDNPREKFLIGK
jgi:DNA-binding protein H-NS